MRSSKVLRAILGLSLGVTLYASTAQAQTEDKRTFFTFSGPIELPGMTLPAGRYVFHIVDTTTSRKVIQVMSEDGKKPFVMANTIPDQRRDAPKDATVAFYETPKGTLWHYDLYRLDPPADLDALGWSEARRSGIALLEWPERAGFIEGPGWSVTLSFTDDPHIRSIDIGAFT